MDWLNLLRKGGKGGGWAAIAVAVLMFISKQFGLPVTEEFWTTILSLFGGGAVAVVGAKFVPDGLPVMSDNERATWDAWWLLDQFLATNTAAKPHLDGLHSAIADHFRTTRPKKKKKSDIDTAKTIVDAVKEEFDLAVAAAKEAKK